MQAMTKPTCTAITQHAKNGKSVIVFVPTRKYVRLTTEDLIAYSGADSGEKPFLLKSIEDLEPLINNINDEMLKGTLREGVGYLHEGLNHHDHITL
jgi:pre-mRNA-splicing helicase BRR2